MEYPARGQFFAHKFVRLIHKTALAAEIGRDALALLVVVVHTEDAMRYRGAAKFWNSQLIETLGFSKWDQFDKARRRAVESGWLNYVCHGRKQAGEYHVLVPDGYSMVDDNPIEHCTALSPESEYDRGYKQGYKQGMIEGITRVQTGGQLGDEQGDLSIPIPDPIPIPEIQAQAAVAADVPVVQKPVKAFARPTVQEVAAYADEIGSAVDPHAFWNYYESNGWKVGRNAMKDWRATVRRWNANPQEAKSNGQHYQSATQAREQRNASSFEKFKRLAAAASLAEGGGSSASSGAIVQREENGGTD